MLIFRRYFSVLLMILVNILEVYLVISYFLVISDSEVADFGDR